MALGEQGASGKACLKWILMPQVASGDRGDTPAKVTVCLRDDWAVRVAGVGGVCGWLYWAGSGGDSPAAEEEAWGAQLQPRGRKTADAGQRTRGDSRASALVEAHRGVLPVQDDLGDVLHGVQQVVVPPLVPVDGHRAVLVHAARHEHATPV